MALILRNLIATAALCGLSLTVSAQTPPAVRQVQVEFAAAARTAPSGLSYRPANNKPMAPVKFYGAFRADPQPYKGPSTIDFFEKGNDLPVARCDIPEGMKNALLLFVPKAQAVEGLKYDVVAIDDSMEKIPTGSFSIINLSGKEYAADYGSGTPIMIKPGISPAYASAGSTGLQLAVAHGEQWRKAGRHDFTLDQNSRGWVIIYPPAKPTSHYPVVRSMVEQLSAEQPVKTHIIARYP